MTEISEKGKRRDRGGEVQEDRLTAGQLSELGNRGGSVVRQGCAVGDAGRRVLWFLFYLFFSLRFLSGGRTWEAVVVTAAAEAGGPGGLVAWFL